MDPRYLLPLVIFFGTLATVAIGVLVAVVLPMRKREIARDMTIAGLSRGVAKLNGDVARLIALLEPKAPAPAFAPLGEHFVDRGSTPTPDPPEPVRARATVLPRRRR